MDCSGKGVGIKNRLHPYERSRSLLELTLRPKAQMVIRFCYYTSVSTGNLKVKVNTLAPSPLICS
jgi:hypothetical protein